MQEQLNDNRIEKAAAFAVTISALLFSVNLIEDYVFLLVDMGLLFFTFWKNSDSFLHKGYSIVDFFWLLFLVTVMINRSRNYETTNLYYFVVGIVAMFVFKSCEEYMEGVFLAIFVFTIANIFACILNLFFMDTFVKLMKFLNVAKLEPYSDNLLTGLANGTSRSASLLIISVSVFFAFWYAADDIKPRQKSFFLAIIVILFALILATGKRGHTLFGFAVILLVFFVNERELSKKIKSTLSIVIIVLISLPIIFILFPQANYIFEIMQVRESGGSLDTGRFEIWNIAFSQFKSNWLFGIGYGAFSTIIIHGKSYAGVHNDYIQWLCELGVVGFTINIVIAIMCLSKCVNMIRQDFEFSSYEKVVLIWSLYIQLFVLMYSLTGLPHYSYDINTIYLIACAVPYAVEFTILKYKEIDI